MAQLECVEGHRCRVTKLRYSIEFDDRNGKKVERILDKFATLFDELAIMGVEARVTYQGSRS